jgi:hypothetical protein
MPSNNRPIHQSPIHAIQQSLHSSVTYSCHQTITPFINANNLSQLFLQLPHPRKASNAPRVTFLLGVENVLVFALIKMQLPTISGPLSQVLTALAAGRWVVTRRFVDRSHKNNDWANPRAFVCDQLVLTHREQRLHARGVGHFAGMRVLFLMENQAKNSVYANIVRAGDGVAIDSWSMDDLLALKPGNLLIILHSAEDKRNLKLFEPPPPTLSLGLCKVINKTKTGGKQEIK